MNNMSRAGRLAGEEQGGMLTEVAGGLPLGAVGWGWGEARVWQAGNEDTVQSMRLFVVADPLRMAFRAKQNKLCSRCCVSAALRMPKERELVCLANGADLSSFSVAL